VGSCNKFNLLKDRKGIEDFAACLAVTTLPMCHSHGRPEGKGAISTHRVFNEFSNGEGHVPLPFCGHCTAIFHWPLTFILRGRGTRGRWLFVTYGLVGYSHRK